MKISPARVAFTLPLFLATALAHSAPISFGTGDPLSDDSTPAAFSGNIELTGATATGGTLTINLTNDSAPSNGGYITAIAFNNPGPVSPLTVSLATSGDATGFTNVLGGPIYIDTVPASPADDFDIGAAIGDNWLGSGGGAGSPAAGIGVGETGQLVFSLGGDLTGLTTQSFIDTLNGDGTDVKGSQWMALRFRGFDDGGSSKYGAGEVPIPAAAWLFGSGLIGLAGMARKRKAS